MARNGKRGDSGGVAKGISVRTEAKARERSLEMLRENGLVKRVLRKCLTKTDDVLVRWA